MPCKFTSVAECLADKTRWTKGTEARDTFGKAIEPDSPNAVQWCAVGAIDSVYGYSPRCDDHYKRLLDVINKEGDRKMSISQWNDDPTRTHIQVLAAVQAAGI